MHCALLHTVSIDALYYTVQCILDCLPVSVSTEPVYIVTSLLTATRIHINYSVRKPVFLLLTLTDHSLGCERKKHCFDQNWCFKCHFLREGTHYFVHQNAIQTLPSRMWEPCCYYSCICSILECRLLFEVCVSSPSGENGHVLALIAHKFSPE